MGKKVKKNVPVLRFPEFEENWKESKLNKLIDLISGQHLSPNEYSLELGEVPYFTGPSDFTNQVEALTKWTALSNKSGQQGDILITVKGNGVGEMLMLKLPNVVIGRQLMAIRPITVVGEIVYYKLFNYKQELQALASGNVIPGLSRSDILNIKIYLPNIAEQENIASFLGAVDRRLTQLRRKRELLQTYKRGVMQKIFAQEIRFKSAIGSEFPDWEEMTLGEITNKIGSGATPRGGEDNYQESGISLFRSMNIYDNCFQEENLAFIDENQARELNNVTVEKDDILLNITGASIARCCIAPVKFLPARVNQHVMIIRPQKNKLNSVFLSNLLVFEDYKNQLFKLGGKGGSTREALTKYHIQNFQVILPSIKEQEKIANFLTAIDRKIEALSRQIYQTEQFKKGLLQKMFI